jgi:hypothetical protein
MGIDGKPIAERFIVFNIPPSNESVLDAIREARDHDTDASFATYNDACVWDNILAEAEACRLFLEPSSRLMSYGEETVALDGAWHIKYSKGVLYQSDENNVIIELEEAMG